MRLPLADATVPAREVFRHFPPTLVVAFYLLSALARVVFVSGAWRRLAKYRAGRPAHRWGHGGERLWRAARTPAGRPTPPEPGPPRRRGLRPRRRSAPPLGLVGARPPRPRVRRPHPVLEVDPHARGRGEPPLPRPGGRTAAAPGARGRPVPPPPLAPPPPPGA